MTRKRRCVQGSVKAARWHERQNSQNKIPRAVLRLGGSGWGRLTETINNLETKLQSFGYRTKQIKVTAVFLELNTKLRLDVTLRETPTEIRYDTYISYGDAVRTRLNEDAFFATTSIAKIIKERLELTNDGIPEKTAYIIHQFKRRREIELTRLIYGRLFLQISVYDKRHVRVDTLARKIPDSRDSSNHNQYRPEAETLVQKDEDEQLNPHGQRVGRDFPRGLISWLTQV